MLDVGQEMGVKKQVQVNETWPHQRSRIVKAKVIIERSRFL